MKKTEFFKNAAWLVAAMSVFTLTGCTSSDRRAEQEAAQEEAFQIEGKLPDPAVAARSEARRFLTASDSVLTVADSVRIERDVQTVRDLRARYLEEQGKRQATIFDSVFFSTLRTVNPQVDASLKSKLNTK